MKHLFFLNRRFGQGGAERQLIALIKALDKRQYVITVAPFYDGGHLARTISNDKDITWAPLKKRGRWDLIGFLWRLWRRAQAASPDVCIGYMDIPNIVAWVVGRLVGAKVVWGVRNSTRDVGSAPVLGRLGFWLMGRLSARPDLIIFNSEAGRRYYRARGFTTDRSVVIPNGIDTVYFSPQEGKSLLRERWGVGGAEVVLGLVGRADPMKNHAIFIAAAARLRDAYPHLRFVCAGMEAGGYRERMQELSRTLGLSDRMIWVDPMDNMPSLYRALDVLVLASAYGEGFPNVVGEAMACGVPCVVTDVGDSAWIVDHTGVVVQPGRPERLAEGMTQMITRLAHEGSVLRIGARARIVCHFSTGALARNTVTAFQRFGVLADRADKSAARG
ncbi:MAG: glycosyltransferase [Acidiferrobacter sp.]